MQDRYKKAPTPSRAILELANKKPELFLDALKKDDPLSITISSILLDATLEESIRELAEESE